MIDPRTHADITGDKDLGVAEVKVYRCGCEYRPSGTLVNTTRWFLCPYHDGFDTACDRFAP
jgi:hypothetical protein